MAVTCKEQTFLANVECIAPITALITAQAELAGLHPKRVMQLELVVEEVVTNICNYAYEVPPGEITVRAITDEGKFVMEFEDGGIPFDPLEAPEPDVKSGLEERDIGGLGILLVRRMTDEVHYRRFDGRNVLSVTIYRA
jgi:serine/threonine-protein kinase RsbW